jgi:hypothetical protein
VDREMVAPADCDRRDNDFSRHPVRGSGQRWIEGSLLSSASL